MRLYRIFTDLERIDDAYVNQCLAWFPTERANAVKAMNFLQGRREKVIAYELLVDLLKECGVYDGLPLLQAEEGRKPFLTNYPDIHFNMSHCKTAVAVAVCDRPIGIDIECPHKISDALMERVCHPEELIQIKSAQDPTLAFIRLWTRKEAVIKYFGSSICTDLHQLLFNHSELTIETHFLESIDSYCSICQQY